MESNRRYTAASTGTSSRHTRRCPLSPQVLGQPAFLKARGLPGRLEGELTRRGVAPHARGPSRITPRTRSTVVDAQGNSTTHHVAPAAMYGAGSVPGAKGTTKSKPSFGFNALISATASAAWSGVSKKPENNRRAGGATPWSLVSDQACYPYRNPRLLDRCGEEAHSVDGVILAPVNNLFACPGAGDHLQ